MFLRQSSILLIMLFLLSGCGGYEESTEEAKQRALKDFSKCSGELVFDSFNWRLLHFVASSGGEYNEKTRNDYFELIDNENPCFFNYMIDPSVHAGYGYAYFRDDGMIKGARFFQYLDGSPAPSLEYYIFFDDGMMYVYDEWSQNLFKVKEGDLSTIKGMGWRYESSVEWREKQEAKGRIK